MVETVVSQHLQDCIARLCITDNQFLKMVRPYLPTQFLGSVVTEFVVRLCFSYYDLFDKAPNNHFFDEFQRAMNRLKEGERPRYIEYVERLRTMPAPETAYILKRVNDFVRAREFEHAAIEFAELVERGQFIAAQNLMYEALRAGVGQENVGLKYLTDLSSLQTRGQGPSILMKSGIEHFNYVFDGFSRGQLVCVLGGYKGKKSWCLTHFGCTAVLQGLKVVHITHELSLRETEERYDRMFGSLSRSEQQRTVNTTRYDKELSSWHVEQLERPSMYNIKEVINTRNAVKRFGGQLIIRKYPMGACSMAEVHQYLTYLETYENFTPDVLINDYADVMKPVDTSVGELRHQIDETYKWHKRIADERQILVFTASQAIRSAYGRRNLTVRDFAEDVRKAANVDVALAVCQTQKMQQANQAALVVLLNRNGPQGVGCKFTMNLDMGQFCFESFPMGFLGFQLTSDDDDIVEQAANNPNSVGN